MKNKNVLLLFALFAFASSVFMTGCKKDEETGPDTKKMVVGTWKFENYSYKESGSEDSYTGHGETVEFKSDGKVVFMDGTTVREGKWTFDNKKVTLDFEDTPKIFDQALMNVYYNFDVKEISSSKLVLFYTGAMGPLKEEYTINFKK